MDTSKQQVNLQRLIFLHCPKMILLSNPTKGVEEDEFIVSISQSKTHPLMSQHPSIFDEHVGRSMHLHTNMINAIVYLEKQLKMLR